MDKHVAFLGASALLVALLGGGCGDPIVIDLTSCEEPYPDPSCPKPPGHVEEETCPGQCVPIPPVDWTDPLLLWTGDELLAPECPADRAGQIVYEGHADPVDAPACPECTCEPATGECGLPSILTVSSGLCGQPGMEYDLSGLDADSTVCNTENGVAAGNDPQSVTIGPLTVMESGCEPPETPPPLGNDAASWKTYGRACRGVAFPPCLDPNLLCVPTAAPPPEGFSQCIYREGDHECPQVYSEKRLFFNDVTDTRSCAPCACGAPTGSVCSATVPLYQDVMCSAFVTELNPDSLGPTCINLTPPPQGQALLGKSVTDITFQPGSCPPSGGEPVGSADLMGPSTFCCQP